MFSPPNSFLFCFNRERAELDTIGMPYKPARLRARASVETTIITTTIVVVAATVPKRAVVWPLRLARRKEWTNLVLCFRVFVYKNKTFIKSAGLCVFFSKRSFRLLRYASTVATHSHASASFAKIAHFCKPIASWLYIYNNFPNLLNLDN